MTGYMIWFVAMAAVIATILAVGTLAAADLLGGHRDAGRVDGPRTQSDAPGSQLRPEDHRGVASQPGRYAA